MDATEILLRQNPINYFDFWLALDAYLHIPYNMFDIFYGCYEGAKEIWKVAIDYGLFLQDPSVLPFNFIYNLGPMIKNLTNLALYFTA